MDCNVLKPLSEFSQLSSLHYMELERDITTCSSVTPHCDECVSSGQHNQITTEVYPDISADNAGSTKSNHKEKNPLVWGDDILFLDQQQQHDQDSRTEDESGGLNYSRTSGPSANRVVNSDIKSTIPGHMQQSDDGQDSNKLELTVTNMVSLSEMSEMSVMESEKYISLSGFNFFPKDEETEDLNDICSSLQLGNIGETHPSSVEEINHSSVIKADECLPLPTARTGLRRTRNASRRMSVHNDDVSFSSQAESLNSNTRKRHMSEHSIMSAGSYDDPDSPLNSCGRRKKRRYEEDPYPDNPDFEKSRKNAIIAKRNREKKKQLMEQMESRCEELSTQNEVLGADNSKLRNRVQTLEEEVFYLKSVLANQSALSGVLSTLKSVDHLRFSSSFEASNQNKKMGTSSSSSSQSQRNSVLPSAAQLKVSGGICLHVDGNQVSMEMCAKCAQMACGAPRSNEVSTKTMASKRSA